MILFPDIPPIVLTLPIILSAIAATRYILGFKTWKNYPVLALALSFYLFFIATNSVLYALGLYLTFSATIIGGALAIRHAMRRLKINHYARIAIMYLGATIFSLVVIALLLTLSSETQFATRDFGIAIFLIGTTIDELAILLFKKDSHEFARRYLTTFVLSTLFGLLLSWSWWNTFIVRHQEVLLAVLTLDIIVAFWTAVRVTELLRFGSIIKNQR